MKTDLISKLEALKYENQFKKDEMDSEMYSFDDGIDRAIEIIKSAIMEEVGKCETVLKVKHKNEKNFAVLPCRILTNESKCLKCQGKLEML